MFLYFEILYISWYFWITWKHVSYDASSRTDTKRERKLFLVFWKWVSHCAGDRTDTI